MAASVRTPASVASSANLSAPPAAGLGRRGFLSLLGVGVAGTLLRPGVSVFAAEESKPAVLIEAEGFERFGGWVLDQQFMDRMGSPMLLAHGLGKPVADATVRVRFPKAGVYHLLVRTRDWIGPWKSADAPAAKTPDLPMCCGLVPITPPTGGELPKASPGVFEVLINGQPHSHVFGTQGADWHWERGGTVEIAEGETTIALHDLTGFEGRCEALLFTMDPCLTPPDGITELTRFRRELRGLTEKAADGGQFDLVVCGGGIAGMCTALMAARQGLKTALIQDRPVVGGNNSSEVRVWLNGTSSDPRVPGLGKILAEYEPPKSKNRTADAEEDRLREERLRAEKNLTLVLGHRIQAVGLKDGGVRDIRGLLEFDRETRASRVAGGDGAIAWVEAESITTGERRRFGGRFFADCTGDACVGFLAGADHEESLPRQGETNLWKVGDAHKPVAFPDCAAWALDLRDVDFPGKVTEPVADRAALAKQLRRLGIWNWESGFHVDPFQNLEQIRDWNLRAMYGAWHYIKNVAGAAPTHDLEWAAYVAGKRESRRLMGDLILDEPDVVGHRPYPDAVVPVSWSVDVHEPAITEGEFKHNSFIAQTDHKRYGGQYLMPYRCLYSRNIPNLFMAGRCISATRRGLGPVRVMRTCGLMGEVVGLAARLCLQHACSPRDVYEKHLPELLAACGKTSA